MTTAHAHSLPSFAQAFSETPLGNALPPIQTRSQPALSRHTSEEERVAGRKRGRAEYTTAARDDEPSDSDRDSPQVKEEQEHDMLEPTPPPQQQPSAAKKRRVTVSGGGAPLLNTDVRVPTESASSTPISPVVMGFTIMRDNPSAIEQVRSSFSVKQKQKALIEQRRGSLVGSPNLGASSAPAALVEEKATTTTRQRRSPNTDTRRPPNGKPPSPPAAQPVPVATQQALPPPPISFARRRAEQLGGKRKPADIIISPREAHTQEQFQPAIQSAPPIPQGGGQSTFYGGRFPMSIPRLPPVMGAADTGRKLGGQVPPTPTRFSMQRNNSSTTIPSISHPAANTRSPPAASVAIASTLVPPTPTALNHSGYSGDKSAFLAPFELFYDSLNDSKQLKAWLGEQLQRSNALIQNLTQQQEKLNETVESIVERKLGSMRAEMNGLYRRVDELEDALRVATGGGRRQSFDSGSGHAAQSTKKPLPPLRNGNHHHHPISETYTFPPRPQPRGESSRRPPSPGPGWATQERDKDRDTQSTLESEGAGGSPAPFDARRLSLSSARLDPPRTSFETSSQRNTLHSPPQGFRESPLAHPRASPSLLAKSHRTSAHAAAERRPGTTSPQPTSSPDDS